MPRRRSIARIAASRVAQQKRLVQVLIILCRKVRRLQTSVAARAACDDVVHWLRVMPAVPRRRRPARKD
ncbi:MAG: hypothetical protein PHE83_03570 [Opitutaceae bacterium]|nr:hypothetical protein [Opitutaceae bacterium]